MSWVDSINDKLIITTGDGKQYTPFWKNASKVLEFNMAEFNFVEVEGSLVKRYKRKGLKFNFEIYFSGNDNLEVANAFEQSTYDSRPWDISHPIYGKITVQPSALSFDYIKNNVTTITGTLMETITDDNPKSTIIPIDKISADKLELDGASSRSFYNGVRSFTIGERRSFLEIEDGYYNEAAMQITETSESEQFINLYNSAQSAILDVTLDPLLAVQKTQEFINYPPGLLSNSVTGRLNLLKNQFTNLSIANLLTKNQKELYQMQAGSYIANMATAAANPQPGNYGTRTQVFNVIGFLLTYYNQFILNLDTLQTATGGVPTSYIPDANTLMRLNDLVNYTISNLFNIALNSKQERSIYVEDDTNVIILAHRFYGLEDESTIQTIIDNNDIGLFELLGIKKGRRIIYYV